MSELRKAAEDALEALESKSGSTELNVRLAVVDATTLLRAALAQPDVDSYQPLTLPRKHVRAAAPTASNHPWPLPEQVLEYIAPVGTTWRDMVKFARRVEQEHGIGGGEARADEQIKGMAQQRHRGGGF